MLHFPLFAILPVCILDQRYRAIYKCT